MKHLLLIVIIILTIGFPAGINSCKNKSDNGETTSNSPDQPENIARTFATTYQPDSLPYEGIGKLEKVPDSIVTAFKSIRLANRTAHNKWLTVTFLKLYLDHLRCCHQGYELRNNPSNGINSAADPLLYEFALSTKLFDVNHRIEFVNSGVAESWLEKNPSLAMDPDIKGIVAELKPVKDSIAKRLYW